ncbi:electron transfer flavoprotein subunit alpha/FixB family protein [bacterium]|nr:electron transfer flavoprotein subunit alpha/FixB family protein [candidate division CSSED10-310 bacterium]
MTGILVIAETRNGTIHKTTREAAGAAMELSRRRSVPAAALLLTETQLAGELGALGFSTVYTVEGERYGKYNSESYTAAAAHAARQCSANIILMGATGMGRDLTARLAARLNGALASDVIRIHYDSDPVSVVRPVYSGKLLAEVELPGSPRIISLRPNVFEPASPSGQQAQVVRLDPDTASIRAQVKQAIQAAQGVLDVTEADIIVSGGRGVGGPEGFGVIRDLAQVLNAAVGASRAAVDSDWIPYKHQVGQTGKVVSPVLYIACGISGAIQHFAGMGSSRFIIAVNKDPDAPIMNKADFAIVGDLFKVVPVLKEELIKILN